MELESFCASDNDPIDYLRGPFRVGDFMVCTDGHRLIAAPTNDDALPRNDQIADAVMKIIADASADDGFVAIPAVDLPEKTECGICRGAGTVTVTECPECDGFGTVDAETDYSTYYDLTCNSCDGVGKTIAPGAGSECRECRGTGNVYQRASIDILGVRLNPAYVAPILDLPGLVVKADPTPCPGKLLFRSGELGGCIMGMTKHQGWSRSARALEN